MNQSQSSKKLYPPRDSCAIEYVVGGASSEGVVGVELRFANFGLTGTRRGFGFVHVRLLARCFVANGESRASRSIEDEFDDDDDDDDEAAGAGIDRFRRRVDFLPRFAFDRELEEEPVSGALCA